MKCKFPWKMYWHGEYTNSGKKKLTSYRIGDTDEEIFVPCGRCMACRVNNARLWAVRCVCEAKEHEENYFLTLTYDDDHVRDVLGNVGVHNIEFVPTANNDEISRFLKALRQDQQRKYGITGCRFLACSEYGDTSFRAHHHMILFGCHIPDARPYKQSRGFWLYRSEYIEKFWKNGEVYIGEVTAESAQYVAKYAIKNTDRYHDLCDALAVDRPCLRMSRRPGIGKTYFEKHKAEILANHGVYIHGMLVPLPDSWLDGVNDYEVDLMEHEAEVRRLAAKEQGRIHGFQDPEDLRFLGIRQLQDDIHSRDAI